MSPSVLGAASPDEATGLALGLDIGSTTVKAVVCQGEQVLRRDYLRHHADVLVAVRDLLSDLHRWRPDAPMRVAVTGSAGVGLAGDLGVPFVQEVVAEVDVVRRRHPQADVLIELGGEDAKLAYLGAAPDMRMNGSCAGGTGAFIDQMAHLLNTDAPGLDELAARHTRLHRIASRCGVFAKSDLQPLLNDGAAPEDLAASVFAAVAGQTIAGLACGRPIRGTVVLLGGPLHFLPQLRAAFERALGPAVTSLIAPPDAHLAVAIGAAGLAGGPETPVAELMRRLDRREPVPQIASLPALFAGDEDYQAFRDRHDRVRTPRLDVGQARGPCFLGLDVGSTTLKACVLDEARRIVWSHYGPNEGDPLGTAVEVLARLHDELPATAWLARSCVTGYGEALVRAGLHCDDGEVETIAHYRAAAHVLPQVSAIVDIGGQDMKYLRVRSGALERICVNEACSSGCGSFLQTFAAGVGVDVAEFARLALGAQAPVDLGSRCTVFMNSRVKQAQKEGAGVADIAAGLAYAVVRNALHKVIRLTDPAQLGEHVVVQGGTFLSDSVLRAFETHTGRQVVRPDISALMGAFGAALIAQERHAAHAPGYASAPPVPSVAALAPEPSPAPPPAARNGARSSVLDAAALRAFAITSEVDHCRRCENLCQTTTTRFAGGEHHVSGNRCERGAGDAPTRRERRGRDDGRPVNLVDWTYRRVFASRRLPRGQARRGEIGVPRVLNMYENYPFWSALLRELGFAVVLSPRSSRSLFEQGLDSIPSENACYPAKLAHGHVEALIRAGVRTIFLPSVPYERVLNEHSDHHYNCPIVTSYPEVLRLNIETLRDRGVRFLNPFVNLADPVTLTRRIVEIFADWQVTAAQAGQAVEAGYAAADRFAADLRDAGAKALANLRATGGRGVVLAGRPYHLDPEIHHGIPELVAGLGLTVLTEAAVAVPGTVARPLRVRDQWAYHSRLYEAAAVVGPDPDLALVQLTSFGCGLDAITSEQVRDILEQAGDAHTLLKIDEVANLGAARIRLRSLDAVWRARRSQVSTATPATPARVSEQVPAQPAPDRVLFTPEMRTRHTVLCPQFTPFHMPFIEAALRACGYRVEVLPDLVEDTAGQSGLALVHNDACYPAVLVAGQVVDALRSGRYDPDATSVLITQTGGMCRATNYPALLRRGLADAGFGQVPVLALSTMRLEEHPGFSWSPGMVHRLLQAVALGDLLQTAVLRVRPYELRPGATEELRARWEGIGREFLTTAPGRGSVTRRPRWHRLAQRLVADFAAVPRHDVARLPRVGVVGEIYVKYHPGANNRVVESLEAAGCEVVLPGLMDFLLNCCATGDWNYRHLGTDRTARHVKRAFVAAMEHYRRPAVRALAASGGLFDVPHRIEHLAERASEMLSLGHQAGEGWFLTAEMITLVEGGVPNVLCVQPFACLPNHVTGRGMFAELRRRYPHANIASVDYDPGASEVNQLNRIALLAATGRARA